MLLFDFDKMHECVSNRVEKNAVGRNRETPEIEAAPPPEEGKDVDIEFEKVVHSETEEYGCYDLRDWKWWHHDRQSRGEC